STLTSRERYFMRSPRGFATCYSKRKPLDNRKTTNTMQFKTVKEPIPTGDPYYDLLEGGYIRPEKLLVSPDEAKRVRDAMKTIREFITKAEETGVIEII